MASTWTLYGTGVGFAVNKSMIGILNAGSRIIRIRRVGLLNNQTAAVTGVVCFGELRRYQTAGISGHTPISPLTHDSTNSALVSVTTFTAGTPSGTPDVLRRYL